MTLVGNVRMEPYYVRKKKLSNVTKELSHVMLKLHNVKMELSNVGLSKTLPVPT